MDSFNAWAATVLDGTVVNIATAISISINWIIILFVMSVVELLVGKFVYWVFKIPEYIKTETGTGAKIKTHYSYRHPLAFVKKLVIIAGLIHGTIEVFSIATARGVLNYFLVFTLSFILLAMIVYHLAYFVERNIRYSLVLFDLGAILVITRYVWLELPRDIHQELNAFSFNFDVAIFISANVIKYVNIIADFGDEYRTWLYVILVVTSILYIVRKNDWLRNMVNMYSNKAISFIKRLSKSKVRVPLDIEASGDSEPQSTIVISTGSRK